MFSAKLKAFSEHLEQHPKATYVTDDKTVAKFSSGSLCLQPETRGSVVRLCSVVRNFTSNQICPTVHLDKITKRSGRHRQRTWRLCKVSSEFCFSA